MNTSPPPLTNDLAQQLRDLPRSQRRVQLHALMPLLDSLFQQGVSHGALASSLSSAGLPLKPESLRKALRRWRQRTTAPNTDASPTFSPAAAPPGPNPPAPRPTPPTAPTAPRPPISDITNKGDLVRLRESRAPIDLNQLAQLARKK